MPASWDGVWVDDKGTFVVLSRENAHFQVGERQAFAYQVRQVPDGYYRGEWRGSREIMFTIDRDTKFVIRHVNPARGSEDRGSSTTLPWPKPLPPSTAADGGEFFIQPGAIGTSGEVKYLEYKVTDGNGTPKLAGALYPSMLLPAITTQGKFSGSGVSLDLSDQNGSISGTCKTSTSTYKAWGTRYADRGSLSLVDGSTGRAVGKVAFSWTPSPGVAKLGRGKVIVTDQVTVTVQCPDFPNGALRVLRRDP